MAKNRQEQLIMKLKHVGLVALLVIPVLYGCGGQATIPEVVEPGVLSQVKLTPLW